MTSGKIKRMDPWPYPLWIAHRGAGKLAPENTLAAFRVGASRDYRAFECDVKLSADGVPFLLHDSSLDRTTSGHGLASNRTWQELSQLDAGGWHSRTFAGEACAARHVAIRWPTTTAAHSGGGLAREDAADRQYSGVAR